MIMIDFMILRLKVAIQTNEEVPFYVGDKELVAASPFFWWNFFPCLVWNVPEYFPFFCTIICYRCNE